LQTGTFAADQSTCLKTVALETGLVPFLETRDTLSLPRDWFTGNGAKGVEGAEEKKDCQEK
jgi:hypothetical protein